MRLWRRAPVPRVSQTGIRASPFPQSATPAGACGSRLNRTPATSGAQLLARVLLSRLRLELKADELLIADDLSVVAGLDHIGIPKPDLHVGAVLMSDPH